MYVNKSSLKHPDLDWAIYRNTIDQCMNEIKTIIGNLIPPHINEFGLSYAFEMHLTQIKKTNDCQIFFDSKISLKLQRISQTMIFRILIELLNNSIKHAKASEVNISISEDEEWITLLFEDNGIGYNIKDTKPGIGLNSINSRVRFLHGKIETTSNKNGTTNIIEIPVHVNI